MVEEDVVSEEIEEAVVETTDDVVVADSSAIENLLRALGSNKSCSACREWRFFCSPPLASITCWHRA